MQIPVDPTQSLLREAALEIYTSYFLLPAARGSATVAVPLSLDTQAAPREEGRERREGDGGWSSRTKKEV